MLELFKTFCRQRFCESICNLISGMHKPNVKLLLGNSFSHKVKVYLNMICSRMKNWISTQVSSTKVVNHIHRDCVLLTPSSFNMDWTHMITAAALANVVYLLTHKYRESIVVLSISKSVEPNEEQKEMTS